MYLLCQAICRQTRLLPWRRVHSLGREYSFSLRSLFYIAACLSQLAVEDHVCVSCLICAIHKANCYVNHVIRSQTTVHVWGAWITFITDQKLFLLYYIVSVTARASLFFCFFFEQWRGKLSQCLHKILDFLSEYDWMIGKPVPKVKNGRQQESIQSMTERMWQP